MIPIPIPSLQVRSVPEAIDLLLLVVEGKAHQASLGDILSALSIATTASKGLMSATDKALLDQLVVDVANLITPINVSIYASPTIVVPAGKYFITLSGTTDITTLILPTKGVEFFFWYPTGSGLTIMGESLKAGDPPLIFIDTL